MSSNGKGAREIINGEKVASQHRPAKPGRELLLVAGRPTRARAGGNPKGEKDGLNSLALRERKAVIFHTLTKGRGKSICDDNIGTTDAVVVVVKTCQDLIWSMDDVSQMNELKSHLRGRSQSPCLRPYRPLPTYPFFGRLQFTNRR